MHQYRRICSTDIYPINFNHNKILVDNSFQLIMNTKNDLLQFTASSMPSTKGNTCVVWYPDDNIKAVSASEPKYECEFNEIWVTFKYFNYIMHHNSTVHNIQSLTFLLGIIIVTE